MSRTSALAFIETMNGGEIENFGYNNWRLASPFELQRRSRSEVISGLTTLNRFLVSVSARSSNNVDPNSVQSPGPVSRWSTRRVSSDDSVYVWPVRFANVFEPLDGVAIIALNSAVIDNAQQADTTIIGDIIVNNPSGEPTLDPDADLVVAKNVDITGDVYAESAILNKDVRVTGTAFVDDLDLETGAGVDGGQEDYVPPAVTVPPFQEAEDSRPESLDVDVPSGSFDLEPGNYLDVTFGKNTTLNFVGPDGGECGTGGLDQQYHMDSLTTGSGSSIFFECPADVRVRGRLFVGKNSSIGPASGSGLDGSDFIFYVAGENDPSNAVDIGQGSTSEANYYAPNGTVRFNESIASRGLLIGMDVWVNGGLTSESAFANRPPVALPLAVLTEGTSPLVITLTGTDPDQGQVFPESESLLFALVAPNPTEGTLGPLTQVPPSNATVTYTASQTGDLPDSFGFRVTDPGGLSGVTVVDINAPDPAEPPVLTGFVVAKDDSIETLVGPATVDISLVAFADVADPSLVVGDFAFTIVSGPTAGTLTTPVPSEPTATDLAPPVPEDLFESVRSATATYTPPVTAGTDSFNFQACGDLNGDGDTADAGECDTATVIIAFDTIVPPVAPVAEDLTLATEEDTPVEINLADGPSEDSGEPGTGRALWGGKGGPDSDENNPKPNADYRFATALTVDGGWVFFNDCAIGTACPDGPFTFSIASGGACVSVTDSFLKSDEYTVADNGQTLGVTSAGVPDDSVSQPDPDLSFADPDYSSGTFVVGAGSHSIDVTRNTGLPGLAAAHIRVDSPGTGLCAAVTNLTATSFTAPTLAALGEVIGGQIQVTVTNTGTVDIAAGTSSAIGFYISTDSVITTADTLLIGGRENLASSAPSGLAVGESITDFLFAGASVNTASPSGNVFIGVLVDEFDTIAESDETDNTASQPILIGVPQPDLVVSSLSHDPANPTTVNDIDFTATVKNVGNASAGASTLSFQIDSLSHPESPSDSAALWSVGALEPGESETIVRAEGIPEAEAVTVTALADFNDVVAELDENNNTSIDTFTVNQAVEGTQLFATITSLPSSGTLVDSTGTAITSAGTALPDTMVTFVPATGFTGTTSFEYTITDPATSLTSAAALVGLAIGLVVDCETDVDDCDDGRP